MGWVLDLFWNSEKDSIEENSFICEFVIGIISIGVLFGSIGYMLRPVSDIIDELHDSHDSDDSDDD